MPIKLQKRSNILCLAAHFRPLGTDKDPQSQKSCKKSEIIVFATDRSLRQERNPTKNAWTPPSEGKRADPPHKKASRQNHASQQGQQGRTCEKYRALATTAGQNPRNSHESQRGQQDTLSERRGGRHLQRQRSRPPPQNPHGPQQRQRGESHEGGLQ